MRFAVAFLASLMCLSGAPRAHSEERPAPRPAADEVFFVFVTVPRGHVEICWHEPGHAETCVFPNQNPMPVPVRCPVINKHFLITVHVLTVAGIVRGWSEQFICLPGIVT